MSRGQPERGREARRVRFRAQAWVLAGLAAAVYVGYVAFMIAKGLGAA